MPASSLAMRSRKPTRGPSSLTQPPAVAAPQPRTRLYNCDLLVSVLECYMTQLVRRNENENSFTPKSSHSRHRHHHHQPVSSNKKSEPSVFHALQSPSITPVEYLRRLARYSYCSRSAFITAFCYLERAERVIEAGLEVNLLSIHRLLLTCVLIATKVVDDVLYDNAHFARVGGLDVKELNMLELDLLKVLQFKLYISAEEFEAYEMRLLDVALTTDDPEYSMLPGRLRNLGFEQRVIVPKVRAWAPASPTSSMEVSFVDE